MNSLMVMCLRFLEQVESDLQWLVHGRVIANHRGIQPEKLLADLIDHREVETHYVYTSQRCPWHVFRAGVRGKAYVRAGGKTRPRWRGPAALGTDHRAVLDRRIEIRRL